LFSLIIYFFIIQTSKIIANFLYIWLELFTSYYSGKKQKPKKDNNLDKIDDNIEEDLEKVEKDEKQEEELALNEDGIFPNKKFIFLKI